MNAVSIPGSEELEALSPSCIEIVQLREAVQYCGYTSYVTKFGRFTGRNLNMPTYNPWDFRYDLYTNETCRYSGYHPGADNPQ
ncbi:hypothetical protein AVEN_164341-1, partial [Araneus ventricosus]